MTKHDKICFIFTCSYKASIKTHFVNKRCYIHFLWVLSSLLKISHTQSFFISLMEKHGVPCCLSLSKQTSASCHSQWAEYGASRLSSAEVYIRGKVSASILKKPRRGRWHSILQPMGSSWCIPLFMCTSGHIQSHLDCQEFSLKPRLPGTAQLTTILAVPLRHWESPGHTSEECLDGREVYWT